MTTSMPAVDAMLIVNTILWLITGRTCLCTKHLYVAVPALGDSKAAVCCYHTTMHTVRYRCLMCMQLLPAVRCPITQATPVSSLACVLRSSSRSFYKVTVTIASSAAAGPEGWALAGLGLDDVHTPRGLSHSMPSDDSQLDALEHSVDVAAVQNSLAHMSMPHGGIKNSRRPQANSPGGYMHLTHAHEATRLFKQLS